MISFLIVSIVLAVAPLDALPTDRSTGCSVSIRTDLTDPSPLVLVKKGNDVDFVNPVDSVGTLTFAKNEEFLLACIGSGNYLVGVGNNNVQEASAFCVSGKTFLVNNVEFQFSSFVCNTSPLSIVRRTGKTCLSGHTEVEIGFELSDRFLRTLEICRDDTTFQNYWSKFNLTKSISGFQSGYVRPSWRQGDDLWGSHNVNTQYVRSVQRATLSEILSSTELGAKYISTTSDYFFARGHLVARADFVYGMGHWSTFWYVNSAPQWQTFNGGNWNDLEQDVRSFASSRQLDLEVWTGNHGITTLPDVNNVEQPLYFYASGSTRALPIPLFFWKIIYDPISRTGTAFIGVNNPYIVNLTSDYYICEDISSKISWLNWKATDIPLGISYACTIDDLRKAVPTLPDLTVVDILA